MNNKIAKKNKPNVPLPIKCKNLYRDPRTGGSLSKGLFFISSAKVHGISLAVRKAPLIPVERIIGVYE